MSCLMPYFLVLKDQVGANQDLVKGRQMYAYSPHNYVSKSLSPPHPLPLKLRFEKSERRWRDDDTSVSDPRKLHEK